MKEKKDTRGGCGMIKAFKGFDKDMKCRGFQYDIGKEYKTDKAEICQCGFHACESPLDVWRYYPPVDGNRFCEVEQSGDIKSGENKFASTELRIGAEIGIPGLIKAHVEYTRSKAASGKDGGDCSNLAGGESSICIVRNGGKAKGGLRSVIVFTDWEWQGAKLLPKRVRTIVIDGGEYKPDTWYTLKNGEVVEAGKKEAK